MFFIFLYSFMTFAFVFMYLPTKSTCICNCLSHFQLCIKPEKIIIEKSGRGTNILTILMASYFI